LTGWLSRVFSLRRYLLANAALFLAFSAACATAHTLPQMIVLRAFQGFTGGVLIPMAFTLVITLLPKSRQPTGLALFAISATFAPAIGPTIGGWLTENYGWEYIFYVNLVPGALMIAMLWYALERTPANPGLLRRGDWLGILTMALGLGTLQTVLEEGNRNDWLHSSFILRLSLIAGISLLLFIIIELFRKEPLLNLRLFLRRNFAFGVLANFLLGMTLYGSVFIMPLYLSTIQGYNAEQIGRVLAWTGLPQLLIIPFVPKMMKRIDSRVLIGVGFGLFAVSNFMNVYLSPDVAGDQLLWPNVVRALGQSLILAPLALIAADGIEADNAASASALFNMLRNLGGAVGIALLQTFLTHREQFHSAMLMQSVSTLNDATRERVQALAGHMVSAGVTDPAVAWHEAVVAIGRVVRHQAYVMAYGDVFYLLGIIMIAALVAISMLKKMSGESVQGAH
jgi:MFS transporter, DHA2 family, multidrug resistance protein